MRTALVVSLLLAPSIAIAQSPHEEALREHAETAPFDFPSLGIHRSPNDATPRVRRVVYGYYPYWVDAWEDVRWDLLTHIAFFSVNIEGDGSIGRTNGWPDTDFVDTAHLFGVKVDVSFTLFSGAAVLQLCGSAANRARGIGNMIDLMEAGGADGINVDFESLDRGTRDCYTGFIRELRETLEARGHEEAVVSLAAPAVDWTNEFDLAALSRYTDVFFIMGYGYHWTRSGKSGPVGQLRVSESWRPHVSISMQRTIASYTKQVPAEQRAVIVFGVPYYGRDWPVASADMHAPTTGDGSARTYAVARRAIAAGRERRYDADSDNPHYVYSSGGTWRHAWYDDEESLAAKYVLALEQGIGGVGMWALGYDEDYPELWDTLDAHFTEEPVVRSGTREAPRRMTLPFTVEDDTRSAPSNYFNYYACAPDTPEYGRETVFEFDVCQRGVVEATVEDAAGVDIDLHLLSALDEAACVARDDRALSIAIDPGRHYLVADTYVDDQVTREGAYTLRAAFVPDDPAAGCRPGERCVAGDCVPPLEGATAEATVTRIEPPTAQWGEPPAPPVVTPPLEETTFVEEEAGCACTSQQRGSLGLGPWLLLALFVRRARQNG